MNTRSSTAARRCPTVESTTQPPEVSTTQCQSQVKARNENKKQTPNFVSDLKRKLNGNDVVEQHAEHSSRKPRPEKSNSSRDDSASGVSTQNNCKQVKRARTGTPEAALNSTPVSKSSNKKLHAGNKRKKRPWESWAPQEKNHFFEALNEFGKDFDKIQMYLKKRRSDSFAVAERNKDQVRHFYYRTHHKISKYIPDPQDSSDAKVLRSLICYGEIRKKIRSLKEKDGKKLTEMIATGKTTFRYNGRNVNIRAPTCRALKRQNATVADDVEQLPQKIMIELTPSDNKTWAVIQSLSHNPRLRTMVSTRKTISGVVTFLLSKWKLPETADLLLTLSKDISVFKQIGSRSCDSESPKVKQVTNINSRSETESNESTKTTKDKCTTLSVKTVLSHESSTFQYSVEDESKCNELPVNQECWSKSNCGNFTIADIFRKLNNPRKISFNYTLCQYQTSNDQLNPALEQLVKLASGELTTNQKNTMSNLSSSKVITKENMSTSERSSKASKVKSSPKVQKLLAPKPPQEMVHPSVIHQVSNTGSSKSGNHLTFGFTPINSIPQTSPFLPKSKKRNAARVVVQRTLLPRPLPVSLLKQNELGNKGQASNFPRKILPKNAALSVDSFIDLALSDDVAENTENVVLPNTIDVRSSDIQTEEIDSGVVSVHNNSMNDECTNKPIIAHDENIAAVVPGDLIDDLKSSEDEDPLKFLSPSHLQNFPTDSWLNEESSDFSIGNLLMQLEGLPSKEKAKNVIDTPKKACPASDSDSHSTNAVSYPDMLDESSVDYVKKFRDLAKKMGNEQDSSSSDNGESRSTINFSSLLSKAAKN